MGGGGGLRSGAVGSLVWYQDKQFVLPGEIGSGQASEHFEHSLTQSQQ